MIEVTFSLVVGKCYRHCHDIFDRFKLIEIEENLEFGLFQKEPILFREEQPKFCCYSRYSLSAMRPLL
jgi:hypothetical protein